ncbi:Ubiquitin-conjugating enzyme E2 J1 [Strongyloides ratti]|uniref:Ubiquitin-conjugating enzyme E2 J1 n=1 Tax=Strongyloides ratti TaxID=34506 RepID=A0A090LN49_STRRB|nr:Ubiquitin-conjugating enzyme E2 J1 [Strongyloides ratti]CEF69599.1 Ubiquitin-conjugating enzyme E2 J1 [Strongyloides ratti]
MPNSKNTQASLRIMKEIRELMNKETDEIFKIHVNEDNLFDIHFTFIGKEKEYLNGLYHGRMILPKDYPMRPPDFWMISESGRFQTNTKICMSNTSFHPDQWSPSWGIRTAILGLISLFYEESQGAVGSISANKNVRKRYAMYSSIYECKKCKSSLYKLWYGIEIEEEKKNYIKNLTSNGETNSNSQQKNDIKTAILGVLQYTFGVLNK